MNKYLHVLRIALLILLLLSSCYDRSDEIVSRASSSVQDFSKNTKGEKKPKIVYSTGEKSSRIQDGKDGLLGISVEDIEGDLRITFKGKLDHATIQLRDCGDNLIFINTYNLIDESIILLIPNAEDYPYQIQIDSYYKIIKGVISLG